MRRVKVQSEDFAFYVDYYNKTHSNEPYYAIYSKLKRCEDRSLCERYAKTLHLLIDDLLLSRQRDIERSEIERSKQVSFDFLGENPL